MSLLIATDEAGYGPRLGPLVIVATAWRLQPGARRQSAHRRLAQAIDLDCVGPLRIDDSKRLFVRGQSSGLKTPRPSAIDLLSDAAATWAAKPLPSEDYRHWLQQIAPDDVQGLGRQPWFGSLAEPSSSAAASPPHAASPPQAASAPVQCAPVQSAGAAAICGGQISQSLIRHWAGGGLHLVDIAARVIDAARFNGLLDVFVNKADLLSHTTCELAVKLWHKHQSSAAPQTHIYSDRHGGRAYYGGLLQHHCPDLTMRVLSESARCSSYCLSETPTAASTTPGRRIDWSFTVSGDSYPPVALSSIIAKSTRERLMTLFNGYFQAEASAHAGFRHQPLRPTAGYTVDANRFLQDIRPIRTHRSLADAILIRRK